MTMATNLPEIRNSGFASIFVSGTRVDATGNEVPTISFKTSEVECVYRPNEPRIVQTALGDTRLVIGLGFKAKGAAAGTRMTFVSFWDAGIDLAQSLKLSTKADPHAYVIEGSYQAPAVNLATGQMYPERFNARVVYEPATAAS
jgi:hypothetical protein